MQPSYKDLHCACQSNSQTNQSSVYSMSDDIWEDDDEDGKEEEEYDRGDNSNDCHKDGISARQLNKQTQSLAMNEIARRHRKQGYVDGLAKHQEENLQKGFDFAYSIGADLGIKVGRLLARACIADGANNDLKDKSGGSGNDLGSLKECMNALNISKVLDLKYFDDHLNLKDGKHGLIEEWQNKSN